MKPGRIETVQHQNLARITRHKPGSIVLRLIRQTSKRPSLTKCAICHGWKIAWARLFEKWIMTISLGSMVIFRKYRLRTVGNLWTEAHRQRLTSLGLLREGFGDFVPSAHTMTGRQDGHIAKAGAGAYFARITCETYPKIGLLRPLYSVSSMSVECFCDAPRFDFSVSGAPKSDELYIDEPLSCPRLTMKPQGTETSGA